jgi:Alr-MurF fusion protein
MDPFDLRLWEGYLQAGGELCEPAIVDQITIDSRRIDSKNTLFVALKGASEDGHKFIDHAAKAGARYALVRKDWHPGITSYNIVILRVEDPLKAFQAIAKAYRQFIGCKIVCIAGSYGKTMVKDLLQLICQTTQRVVASPESFNSQIGVPLSLLTIKKEHQLAIIEAGISKQGEMDVLADLIGPHACIVTHIGKKHTATLGGLAAIASEMIKICHHPQTTEWTLLPNDPFLLPHLPSLNSPHFFWNSPIDSKSLPKAKSLSLEHSSLMPYTIEFPDGNRYSGQINSGFYYIIDLLNITSKAAWLLGIPSEEIKTVLRGYTPEPMRTEIWKSPLGTTFINDAYSSDPQSVDQALKHFEHIPPNGRKIFVFGGMKGNKQHLESDYRRVGKAVNRVKPDMLLIYGKHPFAPLIEEIKTHSNPVEISHCESYTEALQFLQTFLKKDDFVLIKGERKESLDHLTEVFNDSICNNQCIINLAAIQSNLDTLRHRLPKGTKIMVAVKALAYGTDDIRIAKFLGTCGIDILCVSYTDEGIALKRSGVKQDIFVINAAIYEVLKIVKWELEVGVSDRAMIESLAHEGLKHNKRIKVHLHIDTGMGRFGCRPEEALGLALLIKEFPSLILHGIMTHFASADNPVDDDFTLRQVQIFDKAIAEIESQGIAIPWKHAANSSGAIRFYLPQFNMVRIGLAVYGLYSSDATKKALELRLALSLVSRIVGINLCKSGDTVSYGRTYIVKKETQRIAVLPIGYFDGLHRNYSGKGHVIIRGQKAPMVGKICMDYMMVDITDMPNATVGDTVLIFGEDEYGQYLSPEDLASKGDSIVHELITCLGPRIQRIFVYEESQKNH